MARPLKRDGTGTQLNLLLPISGKKGARLSVVRLDKSKMEESRKRLLRDLERTGLRLPTKS